MTKEVLDERKRLEVVLEGLQQRIHAGLISGEEFKKMRRALTEHREQMEQNEDFCSGARSRRTRGHQWEGTLCLQMSKMPGSTVLK